MLVLFETSTGFGLFRIKNKKNLESIENIASMFLDEKSIDKNIELEAFKKFKDTENAVECFNKLNKGELPDDLKKFLKKNIISKNINDTLICNIYYLIYIFIGYESKIASCIQNALNIETDASSKYLEVFRGIRAQLTNLLSGKYLFHFIFWNF